MSLRPREVCIVIASLLACAPAVADEARPKPSIALLGGYGFQVDTINATGVNAYGPAFGARWGATLFGRWYVGATFVAHVGTVESATDAAGSSTYRATYHQTYFGPEAGLDVHFGRFLFRPYVGVGTMVELGRTSVRQFQRNDDDAFFYVAPGALDGFELGRWLLGLDIRLPIVPAEPASKWAPAMFFVIAMTP